LIFIAINVYHELPQKHVFYMLKKGQCTYEICLFYYGYVKCCTDFFKKNYNLIIWFLLWH